MLTRFAFRFSCRQVKLGPRKRMIKVFKLVPQDSTNVGHDLVQFLQDLQLGSLIAPFCNNGALWLSTMRQSLPENSLTIYLGRHLHGGGCAGPLERGP